jgi:hypothetical protein
MPAAVTIHTLTNASVTTTIVDLLTVYPPFPLLGWCTSGHTSDCLLDRCRDEFELAWRQAEPFPVADGSLPVDQHQQRVFAVQQLVDEFMNAAGVAAECLSKRHDSQLRGQASRARGRRRDIPWRL